MISYGAAFSTLLVAGIALSRDHRSPVHQIFAAGLALFAIQAFLTGVAYHASSPEAYLRWQGFQLIAASCLPSVWLAFSLSFTRTNYVEQMSRWKWVLLVSLFLPLTLSVFGTNYFFAQPADLLQVPVKFLHVGLTGYIWNLAWVIFAVVILMNLERSFRHATGHLRWQTKFIFLAVGSIFCTHLFTYSHALLFKGLSGDLVVIKEGVLIIADILILRSLFRGKPLNSSVHLSHQFLYNSFTLLLVGSYFIIVGLIAWLSLQFQWSRNINIAMLMMFIAMIGVAAILMSDRLRIMRKRFISRHFKRPQYDYRKIWENFTARTTSVTETRDLCNVVVRILSETLEILSVTIWLVDEGQEKVSFGSSTAFTDVQVEKLSMFGAEGADLVRAMVGQKMPVDIQDQADVWGEVFKRITWIEESKGARIRYCVPLNASGRLIGIMTLSEKVFHEPLSFEELELVQTIAEQAASALLNLRLSEHLRQAKELEAFQSMSAFFLHDLKNLAAKLTLVTTNLPVHIDNPEFRSDALKTISQSVAKINNMSSRLSLLSRKLELVFRETNVNSLIENTLALTKDFISAPVSKDLGYLPPLFLDREHVEKMLENLLMNACEALGPDGRIKVMTCCRGNWGEISVEDNGCGMSRDYLNRRLFLPFQTTKKQGMGIGLYHCKTIVEAHKGRMEVDSEEGRGTTVRILLPLQETGKATYQIEKQMRGYG